MKKMRVQSCPVVHPNGTVSVAFLRKEDCDLLDRLRWATEVATDPKHREHEWACKVGLLDTVQEIGQQVQSWLLFDQDETEEYVYSSFRNLRREKNPKRGAGRKPRTHRD
jgi:hypothetical protein